VKSRRVSRTRSSCWSRTRSALGPQGFEILEAEIRTPGGGVIIFQGMQNHTADSIKSLEGFDIAWVEEAQSLSQRSHWTCCGRLFASRAGTVVLMEPEQADRSG
jgi:phage terminase large subunit